METSMLRTVSLVLLAEGEIDPAPTIAYALGLASRAGAHLRATVVAPPLLLPALSYSGYAVATQMLTIVERENLARREQAEAAAALIRTEAQRLATSASVETRSAVQDPQTPHLLSVARLSDVCVLSAPEPGVSLQRDLVIDLLFGAGVPLIVAPAQAKAAERPRKIVVAWDGGRVAARAVRDALPLLAAAETVEIVSIHGEKQIESEASAADLAEHLRRHCGAVSAHVLPLEVDGVAATLRGRMRHGGADLLVMGAYGHSRLREFVLGGATRDALARVEFPILMSH
jgi:nucleotide-binding universal stress UspA family protein